MKQLVVSLILAALGMACTGFAEDTPVPAGTFIFSDNDSFFGRMTITPNGAFTGTFREAFDEYQFGQRTFQGSLSYGGEADCFFHYPQLAYAFPFRPSEELTIRHTPGGPTEYVAAIVVTYVSRIGPPQVVTYDLPGYRVLEDPGAAGFYTMLFRATAAPLFGQAPAGTGWAVLRLSQTGQFRCIGRLANGDSFSWGFEARTDRKLDLVYFQSPSTFYPRLRGRVHSTFYGTITLQDVAEVSDADGTVRWHSNPALEEEFITYLPAIASRFTPTTNALSLFTADSAPQSRLGLATFLHPSFPAPKTAQFRFGAQPAILTDSRTLMPSLNWNPNAPRLPGRFHGQVRSGGNRARPFSGVFFPKQQIAEGFFKIQGDSGVVALGKD